MMKPTAIKTTRILCARGFTLIEMIVTVGILAVVAAIAVPSILSFLPGYRLNIATQDLVTNIQQARSEAIKRNAPCTLTFSADGYVAQVGADTLLRAALDDYPGVAMDPAVAGTAITFNARGLVTGLIGNETINGFSVFAIELSNRTVVRRVLLSLSGGVLIQ